MTGTRRAGMRLRKARAEKGLTLRALEAKAGISYASLCRMEHGTNGPSVATALRVCA